MYHCVFPLGHWPENSGCYFLQSLTTFSLSLLIRGYWDSCFCSRNILAKLTTEIMFIYSRRKTFHDNGGWVIFPLFNFKVWIASIWLILRWYVTFIQISFVDWPCHLDGRSATWTFVTLCAILRHMQLLYPRERVSGLLVDIFVMSRKKIKTQYWMCFMVKYSLRTFRDSCVPKTYF